MRHKKEKVKSWQSLRVKARTSLAWAASACHQLPVTERWQLDNHQPSQSIGLAAQTRGVLGFDSRWHGNTLSPILCQTSSNHYHCVFVHPDQIPWQVSNSLALWWKYELYTYVQGKHTYICTYTTISRKCVHGQCSFSKRGVSIRIFESCDILHPLHTQLV